jgi:acyl-CoA thioesterase
VSDPTAEGLGILLEDVAPGTATARMTIRPDMANAHGSCHGGFLFLLADMAFGYACNAHGPAAVAAGADVQFLAPVAVGDVLVATATEVLHRGRTGVYDVTVTRGAEVVLLVRGRSRTVARSSG